ncbi:dihydrodipicolinate synthase family protein [Mariluticola halotolerans]|uniref:dihydrodipicolinate synthase family protein n=1 Tax=Mariluticola halotolerans TaxID=2909283 RepID=UPI0026E37AB7|nr:dihydrodipicolinate synthase family protein [Mariluticola halotolerans]UJQ94322.1 dihydrodipicolinate synthase family protein [Mariluticola halotolerans]
MIAPVDGIIPVMLTPFDDEGKIDWTGLEALIEWYIANGSNALFAVCQSSEMQFLSVEERVELAKFTAKVTNGRIPVVASGHVADGIDDQVAELTAIADTGIDGLVLVSNRLDPNKQGAEIFRQNFDTLMAQLPKDMPLGFYECPAPYRRLLSDDEFKACAQSGRFSVMKDVSCEMGLLMHRVEMSKGTPFAVVNANAAIAWPAMQAGAPGFCGIANNYHPDLYRWLQDHGKNHPDLAEEMATFLVMSALSEAFGYPVIAKILHQRLGTIKSIHSRTIEYDVRERFWALDVVVDRLIQGTAHYRDQIKTLGN